MAGIFSIGPHLPTLAQFALVLLLAMAVPFAARLLRIPTCVGFIVVGVLVGPHLLDIVPKDRSIPDFFADLGKLLLMFFVGLEIDLDQFARTRHRSILFGLLTFTLPMLAGTAAGLAFGYALLPAILIGSLLASHTLIAFPLVSAAGQGNRPSVTVTVGATVLTDMLALLVLAACLSTFRTGFDLTSLLVQVAELAIFAALMVFVLGPVGGWLVQRLKGSEGVSFALLLVIVCAGATLAEAIDLEGIIGAFLAGIAVNRAVHGSPAQERLAFLGECFFIPAFFISTGFLIDLRLLLSTIVGDLPLVAAIVLGLLASKWLAAELIGRAWQLAPADRGLMASLTMPQVAATLAAALVGYQTVNAAGAHLLDQRMLNTILVLVVVTSIVGPVLTQRALRQLAGAATAPGGGPAPLARAAE